MFLSNVCVYGGAEDGVSRCGSIDSKERRENVGCAERKGDWVTAGVSPPRGTFTSPASACLQEKCTGFYCCKGKITPPSSWLQAPRESAARDFCKLGPLWGSSRALVCPFLPLQGFLPVSSSSLPIPVLPPLCPPAFHLPKASPLSARLPACWLALFSL